MRLRRELANWAGSDIEGVCRVLRATYANAGVDLEAAIHLHQLVPELPDDVGDAFRFVIWQLIVQSPPSWLGLLRRGRDALSSVVSADIRACFERAGVMAPVPSAEAIKWLDAVIGLAYSQHDAQLLANGREAEALSFAYEQARLSTYPDAPAVEWVALNNSAAGFDLRSSSVEGGIFAARFIEVKSCQQVPLHIVLTRNEWNTARRIGDAYVFHVWHLPSRTLTEVSVTEMQAHVPDDNGDGTWDSVRVSIFGTE